MTDPETLPPLFAARAERDVVEVSGPDALTFLQGQLSQDIDALAVGTSTWSFVLQPQGKVDAWVRVTKVAADRLVLDVDAGHGDALATRLSRFKIRTNADIVGHRWPVVAVRGVDAPRDELPASVHRLPLAGPAEGYDLLGPGAEVPGGIDERPAAVLEAHRVVHGVPAMGAELDEGTIPAEVGQWIIDTSVSFSKGCFVGQELVARIDSRGGNVPRRLRAIVLDAPVEIGSAVDADGPPAAVTSAAALGGRFVALAFLGRAVEPGASVSVGGVPGVVHELPLRDLGGT